jgi:hypothetical protein
MSVKTSQQARTEAKAATINGPSEPFVSSIPCLKALNTKANPLSLPTVVFPPREKRPCYTNYWTEFLVENCRYEAGVYFHYVVEKNSEPAEILGAGSKEQEQNKPDKETLIDEWFLSPVEVKAITRTPDSREHSYLLEYVPHGDVKTRQILLPQSLLVGRIEELAKFLRSLGLSVLHQHKNRVRDYLDSPSQVLQRQRAEVFLGLRQGHRVAWRTVRSAEPDHW